MSDKNKQIFIEKSKIIHNDKYDYSKVDYINNITKVIIICPEHGEFIQAPSCHIQKKGCVKCGSEIKRQKSKYTLQDLIKKSNEVHGEGHYSYPEQELDSRIKIEIICNIHNHKFSQRMCAHIQGNGCSLCANAKKGQNQKESPIKLNKDVFIERALNVHKNEYDYSKVVYKSIHDKVIITCKLHGEFKQTPNKHWGGQGCPQCRYIKISESLKMSNEVFIEKATEIHGDKYIYNQKINNSKEHINILCKICNITFDQIPNSHLIGHGCPNCAAIERGKSLRLPHEEFIRRAIDAHGDKYDYTNTIYTTQEERVEIKCNKCSYIFKCYPTAHTYNKSGCPLCAKTASKEEREVVDFIRSFYDGQIVENSSNIIGPYELDIFIPDKSFAIEYNGLYWHSESKIPKNKHYMKMDFCRKKGIKLFHIFCDEWRYKQDIVKSMIKYRMGFVDRKLAARKCEFDIISSKEGKEFFNSCHISGDSSAQVYLALKHENEIVCCLSLKTPIQKKHGGVECLEIARFANALNTSISGGFQKLFERAKEYACGKNISTILTYSDLRFGEGMVYEKSGFQFLEETDLDYWYSDGDIRHFRFKFRADKEKGLTEKQVAVNAGVEKVYGCGSKIWKYCTIND